MHSVTLRRAVASVAAGVLALVASVSVAGSVVAHAEDHLTFDSGHMDIFNVTRVNGELKLELKEDVTGYHVLHAPENVTLVVKDKALMEDLDTKLSGDLAAQVGSKGYLLPLTQDPELLWPGWDTMGVREVAEGDTESGTFGTIDINFVDVAGPGKVFLFSSKPMGGGFDSLLKGDTFELKSGATIEQVEPAHVHAFWVFTEPGEYTMKVNATGERNGQMHTSNTATYTWSVGTKKAPEPTPSDSASAQPGEGTHPGDGGATAQPTTSPSKKPASPAPTTPAAPAPSVPKATCFPTQEGGSGAITLLPKIKDDRQSPAQWVSPESLPFALGDRSINTTTQAIGNIPSGTKVWMIGQTQVEGVPWVGANTMNKSILDQTTGEVVWQLTSFSGPGAMEVFTSGNFGQVVGQRWFSGANGSASGAITIPRNTHVHPNWIFSQPGTYRVGITQTATMKDGTHISGVTNLTFNVGSGSGVNSGHFDIGAEIGKAGSKTVWRDANGQPCTPTAADLEAAGYSSSGGLASTGSDVLTLAIVVLAVGFGFLGIGILRYRRVL